MPNLSPRDAHQFLCFTEKKTTQKKQEKRLISMNSEASQQINRVITPSYTLNEDYRCNQGVMSGDQEQLVKELWNRNPNPF